MILSSFCHFLRLVTYPRILLHVLVLHGSIPGPFISPFVLTLPVQQFSIYICGFNREPGQVIEPDFLTQSSSENITDPLTEPRDQLVLHCGRKIAHAPFDL